MTLIEAAILIALFGIVGGVFGCLLTIAEITRRVRKTGNYIFKWYGRWYRVKGCKRP